MEKILIVEDDIAFGTMIQTWLRKKGFEVEKTTSVKAAIQVCEEAERGFDLVLSDLRLPDHDGIFLLQWMRKHGVQVPFIVMTSYAEIQNVVLAMKSGATDYVAKPFHPEILLDKIKEAIKTPKKLDSYLQTAAFSEKKEKAADFAEYVTLTMSGELHGLGGHYSVKLSEDADEKEQIAYQAYENAIPVPDSQDAKEFWVTLKETISQYF